MGKLSLPSVMPTGELAPQQHICCLWSSRSPPEKQRQTDRLPRCLSRDSSVRADVRHEANSNLTRAQSIAIAAASIESAVKAAGGSVRVDLQQPQVWILTRVPRRIPTVVVPVVLLRLFLSAVTYCLHQHAETGAYGTD